MYNLLRKEDTENYANIRLAGTQRFERPCPTDGRLLRAPLSHNAPCQGSLQPFGDNPFRLRFYCYDFGVSSLSDLADSASNRGCRPKRNDGTSHDYAFFSSRRNFPSWLCFSRSAR